jgi:uncharacterized hydrophobic protein (TIGR00271 family)
VITLRVLSSPELTPSLLGLLSEHPGATHVVCHRGAAVAPPGDVVLADLAREAVSDVVTRVRALPGGDVCALTLDAVDTTLSLEADAAEAAAPGLGVDAVVWEEVESRTSQEAQLSVSFLVLLVVATVVAAVALLVDSAVLLVGAMVVGPEFGPVAGVTVALVARRWRLARRSLLALVVGFPLASLAALLFTATVRASVGLPEAYEGTRPATAFVYQPDGFAVLVALLAGVAGVVSLTSAKSAALVGVAVSVTTVPAAADIGVAAAAGRYAECGGAAVQLAVNLVALVVGGAAALAVRRRRPVSRG